MNIYLMVLCCLAARGLDVAVADRYTAAVWTGGGRGGGYVNMIRTGDPDPLSAAVHALDEHASEARAAPQKADIMVLPSDEVDSEDYDEVMRGLSGAARQVGRYLVAPLMLRAGAPRGGPRGGPPSSLERTTLVFDRSVENSTNLIFEKLSISANFSHENTVPYPVILSDRHITPEHFDYYVTASDGHVKSVKMTVRDADSLLAFGAFGRVFERDYDSFSESEDSVHLYNYYIFNEDVCVYLWIRVRILMVIVSIYVLEMM